MFEIIGMIVVGLIVIAIAIAILVLLVKIALVLLPIAIVIGAICLFGIFFCDGNEDKSSYNNSQNKNIEKVEQRIVKNRNQVQRDFHEQVVSLTRQKPDVNLSTIRPEIDSAIALVVYAYRICSEDDGFMPLITSANDYEGHTAKSAHYAGAAIDFRIKDMGSLADRRELVQMIRDELDERFVVLHEDIGLANEHLHIQLRSGSYNRNVTYR